MTDTINNKIPFVPENTIDPAAGLNLSLNTIDALLQVIVQTVGANTPPAVVEGQRFIVGTAPTGAWSGQANKLARFLDGVWQFFDARYVLNAADGLWYVRSASTWSPLAGGNVVGPASAVNNGVALFDGSTGKLLKDGGALGSAAFRQALGTTGSLYGRDSILGTVSQSGGVPTGAIIERGSNANGEYVRLADGTQICTATVYCPNTSEATASIYRTNADTLWTYPAAFAAFVSASGAVGGLTGAWAVSGTGGIGPTTAAFRVSWHSAVVASIGVKVIAIGRWF